MNSLFILVFREVDYGMLFMKLEVWEVGFLVFFVWFCFSYGLQFPELRHPEGHKQVSARCHFIQESCLLHWLIFLESTVTFRDLEGLGCGSPARAEIPQANGQFPLLSLPRMAREFSALSPLPGSSAFWLEELGLESAPGTVWLGRGVRRDLLL